MLNLRSTHRGYTAIVVLVFSFLIAAFFSIAAEAVTNCVICFVTGFFTIAVMHMKKIESVKDKSSDMDKKSFH